MNKQTSSFKKSLLRNTVLAGISTLLLCVGAAEARRAYSYADMYSPPQQAEAEVVKPKKKPRKTKSKPISVHVQKPIEKESENATPVTDLPIEKKELIKAPETVVEAPKPKKTAPKETVTSKLPEKRNSPDQDKAKSITLEELLGADVVKGMSSR
ncbi:MAG: hypothetical protein KIT34_08155 [Cyanobacteria bacterium TGS_CYA1]|nr:hypothetical protein [Cyanobacteria bacterium TGS_CYA1]